MFTGIIERTGAVRGVSRRGAAARLTVEADAEFWSPLPLGASVAIDGVCLTLVERRGAAAEFDVIPETLQRTTLGQVAPGHDVNLERALSAGARLDGHFVQGHVDAVAVVARVTRAGGDARWLFELDPAALRYVIPKGSIAIDGISLTVVDVTRREFSVAIIPATLERTTLGRKLAGARVNIETDILARTVVRTLESMDLARAGPPSDRPPARAEFGP
ncbi:MAG: riboflavin synthase [Phycisphaerae bacterium]